MSQPWLARQPARDLADPGQALDVLLDLGLADLDLEGLEAVRPPAPDLVDQRVQRLVQIDAAGIGQDALAAGAEQCHQRFAGLLRGQIPECDVEGRQRGRGHPAAAHVVEVMPALVPQAARRCRLADDERCDVVVEHRPERHAAGARGVAEAGADKAGVGCHVGDDQLDVGDVVDRIAPGPARKRQARQLRRDGRDAHDLPPSLMIFAPQDVRRHSATQVARGRRAGAASAPQVATSSRICMTSVRTPSGVSKKAIRRLPNAAAIVRGSMMKLTPAARRRAICASKSSTS
jgi:hypothetical protein